MNRLQLLFSKSLVHYLWEEILVRYRFKYVLPRITQTVLDDIRLDLSNLSLKVRNRILAGLYEVNEKRLCQEFLAPDDSVLELGGAIGFIGLICQKKIGIRNYFIVEANPATLEILRRNYQLNELSPTAWNMALGPTDGYVDLEVGSDFWENSVLPPENGLAPAKTVRVRSASFRTLLEQAGPKITALVVDVEGAEQFIDLEAIPEPVTKIVIELHPAALGPDKTHKLIAGLIAKGFYVAREEGATFVFLRQARAC